VIAGKKEQLTSELPAPAGCVKDSAAYGRVALGFPVWQFTCPQAVASFLPPYDSSGKAVRRSARAAAARGRSAPTAPATSRTVSTPTR